MNENSPGIYLTPFQHQLLRDNIDRDLPAAHRQRLEIMLLTDAGKTQAAICRSLGCSVATASRWMQLTKAGLAHQYLDYPVGRPKLVTAEYIEFLRELLEHSPKDYGYPFKTWTVSWLGKHIAKEKGIAVSQSHLKRVMRELGLSTRTVAQQTHSQPRANISIGDLSDLSVDVPSEQLSRRKDNQELEINLFHFKLDTQIYGSAAHVYSYFASAARRDFSCCPHSTGLSILS
jgi:transposase